MSQEELNKDIERGRDCAKKLRKTIIDQAHQSEKELLFWASFIGYIAGHGAGSIGGGAMAAILESIKPIVEHLKAVPDADKSTKH